MHLNIRTTGNSCTHIFFFTNTVFANTTLSVFSYQVKPVSILFFHHDFIYEYSEAKYSAGGATAAAHTGVSLPK